MDYNTVLVSIVAVLISIVAYFLQRLVKTLDRIDANVNNHTVEITAIKETVKHVPNIDQRLETVIIDLTVLRNEHQEYKARCQRQTTN